MTVLDGVKKQENHTQKMPCSRYNV